MSLQTDILGADYSALMQNGVAVSCRSGLPQRTRFVTANRYGATYQTARIKVFAMDNFSFLVGVTGIDIGDVPYEDALFEAGCDDALVLVVDGELRLDFDRQAKTFEMAVESAKADIYKAGGRVAYVKRHEKI